MKCLKPTSGRPYSRHQALECTIQWLAPGACLSPQLENDMSSAAITDFGHGTWVVITILALSCPRGDMLPSDLSQTPGNLVFSLEDACVFLLLAFPCLSLWEFSTQQRPVPVHKTDYNLSVGEGQRSWYTQTQTLFINTCWPLEHVWPTTVYVYTAPSKNTIQEKKWVKS